MKCRNVILAEYVKSCHFQVQPDGLTQCSALLKNNLNKIIFGLKNVIDSISVCARACVRVCVCFTSFTSGTKRNYNNNDHCQKGFPEHSPSSIRRWNW